VAVLRNFPKQARDLGRIARLTLGGRKYSGRVVRHDIKAPWIKIIEVQNAEFRVGGGVKGKLQKGNFYLLGEEGKNFKGFPKQGDRFGRTGEVLFKRMVEIKKPPGKKGVTDMVTEYDTENWFTVQVVRDDIFDSVIKSDVMIFKIKDSSKFITEKECLLWT